MRPAPAPLAAAGTGWRPAWSAALLPGAERIAAIAGLPAALAGADLVITGEGRYDATSLGGKVVGAVLAAAAAAGVAAAVVAGELAAAPSPQVNAVELTALAGSTQGAIGDPGRWLTMAARLLASGRWPTSAG